MGWNHGTAPLLAICSVASHRHQGQRHVRGPATPETTVVDLPIITCLYVKLSRPQILKFRPRKT